MPVAKSIRDMLLTEDVEELFELICTFQQEEASTHITILQLATGGRSHPRKKWCVEIDRRIETMMQRFEDSTISLTDYLSGLSYLVCAYVTDS